MLIEMIIFIFIGILAGTLTGLIPGIHMNLIGSIIVALSLSFLSSINSIYLIVFIASMAIAHTFVSFIPSIFLGCPDTDTELSILPGHELLKKGHGYKAVILTNYGSIAAIGILILILIPSFLFLSKIQNILLTKIPFPLLSSISILPLLLIFISIFLICSEKKKFSALLSFLLTGILGLIILGNSLIETPFFSGLNIKEPLLPLLTGLFGASTLILSIRSKTKLKKQKIENPNLKRNFKKNILSPLFGALIASPFSSLLPGLGSGQAAIIGNFISKTNREGFLVLLGATNTLVMAFSFVSLYLISKTRTGATVAIKNLIGIPNFNLLFLILTVVLISGVISFIITFKLAKFFAHNLSKVDYILLSKITLVFLTIIILLISNFQGLLAFIISTITGIYCILLGIKRTHMMGCLLLPTIIFYLFL